MVIRNLSEQCMVFMQTCESYPQPALQTLTKSYPTTALQILAKNCFATFFCQIHVKKIWMERSDQYSQIRFSSKRDLPKVEMSYIGG